MELAVLAEVDIGALDADEDDGVLGIRFGADERVNGTAGFVEVGAGDLGLIRVLQVVPLPREGVHLGDAGVVVQRDL